MILKTCWMKYHRCGEGSCQCHCIDCKNDPNLIKKQRQGTYIYNLHV
jgi:hypothetical protein